MSKEENVATFSLSSSFHKWRGFFFLVHEIRNESYCVDWASLEDFLLHHALLAYSSQDILHLPHWVNLILYGKQKKCCGYTSLPCSPATVIICTIKVIFWSPCILYFNQSKTLHGEINNLRTHKDHRWDTEMAPSSARVSSFLVAILFFCVYVHDPRYMSLMPGVFLVPGTRAKAAVGLEPTVFLVPFWLYFVICSPLMPVRARHVFFSF